MTRYLGVRFAAVALLAMAAGCGDNGTTDFSLEATIDGATFKSSVVQASRDATSLIVSGAGGTRILTLQVAIPSAPGTVPLGVDNAASYAEILDGAGMWGTENGGTGSVTFSTITANSASGSFAFTAPFSPATSATGTKIVTGGSFKVQF